MSPQTLPLKTRMLNGARRIFQLRPMEFAVQKLAEGAALESFAGKLLPNHYQYQKPSFRQVTRNGLRFDLDISDLVDWAVFFGLREKSLDRLFQSVKPGFVIVDVGANIGATVLPLAKAAGVQGRVFAFEPDPVNFARCRRNLELNRVSNVLLSDLALAHRIGSFDLFQVQPGNPGMNRILEAGEGDSVKVKSSTLDAFVAKEGLSRVDLIKMDIEGFEMNALLGAEQTLGRFKPDLHIELSDENLRANGQSAAGLVAYLSQWDYQMIDAETGETVVSSPEFLASKRDIWCSTKKL